MKYRALGATGLRVSEIGLGCEGFIGKDEAFTHQMFAAALKAGVNCMDLYSPDPEMQQRVGREVAPVRENFVLQAHLCSVWQNGQYKASRDRAEVEQAFEAMLENLGTDHVDVGMIHYVDSLDTWQQVIDNGILDYALQLKAQGKIRSIGLSSHNPIAAQAAVDSGVVEVLMFSVNPCYDLLPGDENCETLWADESYEKPLINLDPQREALYESCQRRGVGITVMKAFGGGDLLTDESPAGKALTVDQCIHYCLTRPAVAVVMSGARSMDDLERTLAYEQASEAERDYAAAFAAFPKISWEGHCMYCGHCAPCPVGIDVASVTKFLRLCRAQGQVPETVREHYAALHCHAADCVGCGGCESRCPFHVKVRENMAEAAELFGF